MLMFFVILQIILFLFMIFHDWIPVKPFNDVETLKRVDGNYHRLLGSFINGMTVLIPLIITLYYFKSSIIPFTPNVCICIFYLMISIGTILSWWTPYFYGSSEQHKERFKKFAKTHHFLPPRGDHVIPNTLHVVLHLQVWACFVISIYFLIRNFSG